MIKVQVNIDEKWPVFTLEKNEKDGPFVLDINDEFYTEYCYVMYKYNEFQTRLGLIYEYEQRKYNGESFEEDREYNDSRVPDDASKASLRAFLHESN